MSLLSAADYPAIRAALDISLDSTVLPDSVVGQAVYVGAAELAVKERDPLAESRTGDDATRVKMAAVLFAASYLAPAVPQVTGQTLSTDSFSLAAKDWQALARHLAQRAEEQIRVVLSSSRGSHFGRAVGRRGVW